MSGETLPNGNVTVADVLDRWMRRAVASKDLAPQTVEAYRWSADRIAAELGTKRLRSLSVDMVEAALDRMAKGSNEVRPLSRSALIKVRSVLGQALDFAVRRNLVNRTLRDTRS